MTSESDKQEADTLDNAFSNPVLTTYLPNRHIYIPCLVSILGLAMTVGGPLGGGVLRRSTARSLWERQSINDATSCFGQQSDNQQCPDAYSISLTFFAVGNVDDIRTNNATPRLTERGPYLFEAIPVHANVEYLDNQVQFTEKPLKLRKACDSCNWNEEITVLYDGDLQTGTPTDLATALLMQPDTIVVLLTGASKAHNPYRVIAHDGERYPSVEAIYEAKVVGDAYNPNSAIKIFDRWLRTTLKFSPLSKIEQKGLDAIKLQLSDCQAAGGRCEEAEWEVEEAVYTLPYKHLDNGTMSSLPPRSSNSHLWEVVVDKHYGYTITTTRHYQQNHRIDAFGYSYWAASHWMKVSTSITDDDVDFIKTTLRKTKMGYILLDLVTTLAGVIVFVLSVAVMCWTPSARRRLRLLALRARSRARDPRLNIGQFNTMGKFIERQMRRKKKTTQSSDAPQGNVGHSTTTQGRDFDDVRSIPATTNPTV